MANQSLSILLEIKAKLEPALAAVRGFNQHIKSTIEYNTKLLNGTKALVQWAGAASTVLSVRALAAYAQDAIQARKEQETLVQALRSHGFEITRNVTALRMQQDALEALTGVDGEEIASVQRRLIMYGVEGRYLSQLTALTLDLAAARGISTAAAAEQIAKGRVEGFDVNRTLSGDAQRESLIAQLQAAVGGQAAQRFASSGPLAQSSNGPQPTGIGDGQACCHRLATSCGRASRSLILCCKVILIIGSCYRTSRISGVRAANG